MNFSFLSASILILAVALPLSIAATNAALGLMTLSILFRREAREALLACKNNPAVWAMLFYFLAGLISTIFGIDAAHSLRDNIKDLHKLWALCLFITALRLESSDIIWDAFALGVSGAVIVGLGQALLGIYHHLPGYPLPRAHAFVHPVTYGDQLTLSLLGAYCFCILPERRLQPPSHRWAIPLLIVLTAVALVFNQTRAAIFALSGAFIVLSIFNVQARRHGQWVAVALVGLVLIWEILPTGDRSLFKQIHNFDLHNPQNVRYVLWSVAWKMFRTYPWTGTGPANYHTLFEHYFSGSLDNERIWSSAHNLYLHQLAERGLLGITALIGALATLGRTAWAAARREATARSLWAVAAIPAFLIMNLTETAFQNEQLTTFLLFIWAWGTTQHAPRKYL